MKFLLHIEFGNTINLKISNQLNCNHPYVVYKLKQLIHHLNIKPHYFNNYIWIIDYNVQKTKLKINIMSDHTLDKYEFIDQYYIFVNLFINDKFWLISERFNHYLILISYENCCVVSYYFTTWDRIIKSLLNINDPPKKYFNEYHIKPSSLQPILMK